MQCVILAGGLGIRMQPATSTVPKALLPVCGRPFVHHQLSWLKDQGVRDVVLCIGYRGAQLRSFVGDGGAWNVEVRYVDEGDELRGTAGALRRALDQGVLAESCTVLYGDSYLPIELPPIWRAFTQRGERALMVVFRNENRWDASNVLYEGGLVLEYDKRNAGQRPELVWIDYGLAVLARDLIAERIEPDSVADLADLYAELSRARVLGGLEAEERFYEVGSPAGRADLEHYLACTTSHASI
jgi:MurNAc alpha-1-phosphate uridylyltransferase